MAAPCGAVIVVSAPVWPPDPAAPRYGVAMADLMARLHCFFAAENARDWSSYGSFLHPEVTWILGDRVIQGVDEYLAAMQRAYGDSEVQFHCVWSQVSESGSRIATLLVDDDGRRSLDVFEFRDELVWLEHEFLLGRDLGGGTRLG